MAKLTARGGRFRELLRIQLGTEQRVLRSDRAILVKYGIGGWTKRAILKPEATPESWLLAAVNAGWTLQKDSR